MVCRGEGVSCPEGQKSSTYVYVCVCVCIYHTYIIRYLPSRNVHRENIICIYIYICIYAATVPLRSTSPQFPKQEAALQLRFRRHKGAEEVDRSTESRGAEVSV